MPDKNENKNLIEQLNSKRENAQKGGGDRRIESQKKKGKLTARERLALFFDNSDFEEVDIFVQHQSKDLGLDKSVYDGDSVVTAYGFVNGRQTFAYAQDFTVLGGSLSLVAGKKIAKIMDMASKNGAPIIGFNDSGGARIQEGVDSLAGYGEVFVRNTMYSGVVPQITVIVGPSAGGAVYSPAITDFIFMVENTSYMFVTGPDVVKTVTNEEVTSEQLGGSEVHTTVSSVADGAYENDLEMMEQIRELIDFLPSSNTNQAPIKETNDPIDRIENSLDTLVPDNSNTPYDIKELILKVIDEKDFFCLLYTSDAADE